MLRILIAEDNQAFRTGLKRLLEGQSGWEVVAEAANGHEAVEMAQQLQPDITILDYMMPVLDGLTAAEQIQKNAPHAKIVMLTQHDAPFTATRALSVGIRGYVVKSDASRELLPAIEAVWEQNTFLSSTISTVLSQGRA